MGHSDAARVVGLVLAGGQASRFGSEKAMALLGGKPLLAWALSKLQAISETVAINAPDGSGAARYAAGANLPIVHDVEDDRRSPLRGICAGLLWAREVGANRLITLPCDTPLVPAEALKALLSENAEAAVIATPRGLESLCALWPVGCVEMLLPLAQEVRHPPLHDIHRRLGSRIVHWASADAFRNVNTAADLIDIQNRLLAARTEET